MKTAVLAMLGCALLTTGSIAAQEAGENNVVARTNQKALVVLGKISEDGKILFTDLESEWTVSNPEMLKGLEGRLVRVKCYVDTEKNRIRVLFVKKESGELTFAARRSDSAFHR